MLSSVAFCRQRVVKPKVKLCVTQQPWVLDGFRKLHYDLEVFSFDGECVYEDLRCLRNKTNMLEEKQIRFSSNFFLLCKQENEI